MIQGAEICGCRQCDCWYPTWLYDLCFDCDQGKHHNLDDDE